VIKTKIPVTNGRTRYYNLIEKIGIQANFENLLDKKYFIYADGNDNISPASPRSVRLSLTWKF
jgi:catecholate siderophore receptor